MADILDLQVPSALLLPKQEDWEDFVEGCFQYNGATVGVYYEHSLG
jgi:hypothetical protein